jgi:transcriptional regulator with XRE-family HTH domain
MELSNKAVGRNLAKFRMMRDMKASDLAERVGMKEAAYTKYERGESKVTIDLVQKVATVLKVDPIMILSASPDNFIETISNNTVASGGVALMGNGDLEVKGDVNSVDKQHQDLMMKVLENQNELAKKVIALLEKK